MIIKQLSIFVENSTGKLSEIADILADNNINLHALTLADTENFGVLRLITDEPERTKAVLKSSGISATLTDVLAVEIKDEAGGLASLIKLIDHEHLNIEYLYTFVEKTQNRAISIIRIEKIVTAIETLVTHGWKVLKAEDVINL